MGEGSEKQLWRLIVLCSSTTTVWTASVPDLQLRPASGPSNLDVSPAAGPRQTVQTDDPMRKAMRPSCLSTAAALSAPTLPAFSWT